MAELAFGIAEKVLEKLESSVYQELRLACGVKSDVERLKGTMSTIKNVLLDAEEKQATDRKLRDWLGQLRDVFYNAEDVLDEIQCEALRKQVVKTYGSTGEKVRHYFSCSSSLPLRFKLGHKIKGIRERLDQIAAEKDQFNLVERREDGNVMTRLRDMTHSFVDPSAVIGREKEKKEIIDLLLRSDPSKNVNVIPIVGLVGVGKTALAKMVYNDGRVGSHFQLRMWVCVSEDFNLTRLVKEIVKSAGLGFDEDSITVEMLQTSLRELIKKRKFLLVLDDVWNDELGKWIELRDLLVGGSKGSKILVTTRSQSVASIMGTVPSYTLKGLSQKDCLSLFVRWAFKEREDKKFPNLLKIGEDIVKKCNGVPFGSEDFRLPPVFEI